ncbi:MULTISPECIES: replicative DNA helicase [Streptomyces]|uniref:replicative DNA helicase n=1 Tax=Streptomyces TaxID=1883 RepID=UPI00073DF337|nr:replicative DNA helicase [Streptomyces sp. FBKL.4005]OYP10253.1 replicative DNA helicase [Streptomyces sp. FBKL.4005]CUW33428.1 Replicative DNA helicase [Streptomyces reticuli]
MSVPTQHGGIEDNGGSLFDEGPQTVPFERLPPNDVEAEQAELGGMLLSRDAIGEVNETGVTSEAYYRPAHGIIHDAIMDLYGKGQPVDPITVTAYLTKSGDIERIGGASYLHHLVQMVPTAASAAYYAEIVVERYKLRRLIEAGTRIVQMGYAAEGEVADIVNAAQAEMQSAAQLGAGGGVERVQWVDDMLEDYLVSMDAPPPSRLPLPYERLREMLPMEPGDLIVVAARPAIGKSVVLLDIARCVAIEHRMTVMVSSMEMSRPQLMERLMAAEARVPLNRIKDRAFQNDDKQRIFDAAVRINGAPLVVDDGPAATTVQLRSRLRWLQAQGKLPSVLVVDYLQIMKASGKRGQNRTGEVDEISRGLKELAGEFGIIVIAAAQLNREVEKREDKKPMMADLRESGSIEADANAVILLHRPDAYDKEHERAGEMDLIIGKNRQGPTGTVTVAFQGHYARCRDLGTGF